jgi:hypothetical protein
LLACWCAAGVPQEDEAARAYDRMMLWCEIHGAAGSMKGTMTNFDMTEYEKDIAWLTNIAQVSDTGLLVCSLGASHVNT